MATPPLVYISHERFLADVQSLAAAIEAEDWRPDFLVGVGRGGLAPAVYLSHRLALPMLSVDHSTGVHGFGDGLLADLALRAAAGERLLLIDDINDSGGTIACLRQRLTGQGGAAGAVRFAVLIDNVRSSERVTYRARTIDRATDKSWLVFPWEALAQHGALIAEAESLPARLA